MATLQEVHAVYVETGREYYRTDSLFGSVPGHMIADKTIHEAAVFNYPWNESDKRRRNNMPLTPADILAEDWVNEPDAEWVPIKRAHQCKTSGSYMVLDSKKVEGENSWYAVGFMQHDGDPKRIPKEFLYIGPIDPKSLLQK